MTKAAASHNVTGGAWSTNIGWISFSCDDTNSCGTVNYGVDVDPNTGALSGQAWSNNIGWISFTQADLSGCPTYPNCSSSYNTSTGNLTGWAHACGGKTTGVCSTGSSRGDGWDGWISLSSSSGVTYGAKLNVNANGSGQAWGSDVVGWIDFSNVQYNLAAVNGACQNPPNGSSYYTAPIAACSAGTPSAISGTGPWTWSCTGSNGGTTASCSASKKTDGACGSSNGGTFSSAPSTNLCSAGTATTVSGTGPWTWSCNGINGGTSPGCSANSASVPSVTLYANGASGTSTVASGTQVTLSWSGSNLYPSGNNCTISGSGNGTIPPSAVASPSGSILGWAATNPPATVTTYSIWCLGSDGVTHSNTSTATVNIASAASPSITLTPWCYNNQGVISLSFANISSGTSCSGTAPWTSVPASAETKYKAAGSYSLTCGSASSGPVTVPNTPCTNTAPGGPAPAKKPIFIEF
jgi:hypothetical protein